MTDSQDTTIHEIPKGFCHCGCGERTNLVKKTNKSRGWTKGQPVSFVHGHNARRELNGHWKGGRAQKGDYVRIRKPIHPRAHYGYVLEHILMAEKALGKPLPDKAVIHHHTPQELVACQDQGYHMLLHQRTRAYIACGNSNWRKCTHCQKYDHPDKLYIGKTRAPSHKDCQNQYQLERRNL